MSLSVVIVTHNSAAVIERCRKMLRAQLPAAEVVVVDNASSDGTPHLCDGERLIANTINVGFGRACNQGVAAATGTHVLILNPDVQLTHVEEVELERELRSSPFGLVAPVLEQGAPGGSVAQHWSRDLVGHVAGPLRPRELPVLPKRVKPQDGWWPPGALLLVAKSEFTRVGGFDPRFFLYYEDQDLARRYRAAGLPVRSTRAVRARHQRGQSSTGEAAGAAVRQGWSYLSWIEYLFMWHGSATAVRAARSARAMRALIDRALAVLERGGPLSGRAARKRSELAELEQFVRWQSSLGEGTAASDFCPNAREIVATL